MRKILHMIIAVSIAVLVTVTFVHPTNASDTDGNDLFIIELINWIRLDPLSYAEGLGYNRQSILNDLPWLADLTEEQLPLLEITQFLKDKATLLNNPDSLEAILVPDASEDYARTGEITGVISSGNFMDPRTAIRIIINNQFKNEIDPGFAGQICILNKEFDLAGSSFSAGNSSLTTLSVNTYFVTATLGSSVLKTRRQTLNLINQVRNDPSGSASWLGLNLDEFSGNYAPLFFEEVLQDFILTEFAAMEDYATHVRNYGYTGHGVSLSSAIEIFPKADANAAVLWIFSSLILNEVKGLTNGSVIFNPYFNETGINYLMVSGNDSDLVKLNLISGLSDSKKAGYAKLYGLIYRDINLNDGYTPGEGASNRLLSIYDRQTFQRVTTAVTDNTGHFSVSLASNKEYIIQTGSGVDLAGRDIVLGSSDMFFDLKVAH